MVDSKTKRNEGTMSSPAVPDLRGKMFRSKRLMPDAEAREFLRKQRIAHVGTADGNGWPRARRRLDCVTFVTDGCDTGN